MRSFLRATRVPRACHCVRTVDMTLEQAAQETNPGNWLGGRRGREKGKKPFLFRDGGRIAGYEGEGGNQAIQRMYVKHHLSLLTAYSRLAVLCSLALSITERCLRLQNISFFHLKK